MHIFESKQNTNNLLNKIPTYIHTANTSISVKFTIIIILTQSINDSAEFIYLRFQTPISVIRCLHNYALCTFLNQNKIPSTFYHILQQKSRHTYTQHNY